MYKTLLTADVFRKKRPKLLYGRLLARFIFYRLAKFGRVPFADLRVRSLASECGSAISEIARDADVGAHSLSLT